MSSLFTFSLFEFYLNIKKNIYFFQFLTVDHYNFLYLTFTSIRINIDISGNSLKDIYLYSEHNLQDLTKFSYFGTFSKTL